MAATYGPKVKIGSFKVGSGKKLGGGSLPQLIARVSFSDVGAYPTVWEDVTSRVRDWSTSRGGDSEQQDQNAGTATVTFDNRDRRFDPTFNAAAKPMNQLWLLEQFSGEIQSLFKGYVESYDQTWPAPGFGDALVIANAADEFKVLALDALPVMDPPQDTYQALVSYDKPDGYWQFNDPVLTFQIAATVGNNLLIANAISPVTDNPIVGDNGGPNGVGSYDIAPGSRVFAPEENNEGNTGDATGLAEITVEMWVKVQTTPGGDNDLFVTGPSEGTEEMYRIGIDSIRRVGFFARDWVGNTYQLTGGTLTRSDIFYHVVCTISGNYMRTYVNGVQAAAMNWASVFGTIDPAGTPFRVGKITNNKTYRFGHVAFYRHGLTADRVLAHYQAGTQRGYAVNVQTVGASFIPKSRVNDILDTVRNTAPRSLQAESRIMRAAFMKGQSPLEEARESVRVEQIDGMLFVAGDGTVTFLNNDHNDSPPYDTVQALYGDGVAPIANQRPYEDVDFDYSDSFVTNEVNAAKVDGTLQTSSNAFSISRYGKRSQTISDLKVNQDDYAREIADAIVGRYKDPQLRILSLSLVVADPDLALETFRLELGSRIRLLRAVEGGYIDRNLFVKKIEVAGANDGHYWTVRLGVADATVTLGPTVTSYANFDALTAGFGTFDDLQVAATL